MTDHEIEMYCNKLDPIKDRQLKYILVWPKDNKNIQKDELFSVAECFFGKRMNTHLKKEIKKYRYIRPSTNTDLIEGWAFERDLRKDISYILIDILNLSQKIKDFKYTLNLDFGLDFSYEDL